MPDDPQDSLRVLIVDDERLARQRLESLLEREDDVEIVGRATNGQEAVESIRTKREAGMPIDIVFLDVQMPGMNGLEVVRRIGPDAMPITVFVTAYDQHTLTAFEFAAVDYLLKPFENERFRHTLQRARETVRLRKVDVLHDRLRGLLAGRPAEPERRDIAETKYLERIAVEMRGQIRVIPIKDVDYLAAEGNYVRVHSGDESYLLSETLSALEERLEPREFFRIHRSTIVRLDRVEAMHTASGGDYAVRLRDDTVLKLARSRRDAFAERLGLDV